MTKNNKDAIKAFSSFLAVHGGDTDNVVEVVCDMSPAFISGVTEYLPKAEVTVDWFHIVQTFTKRLGHAHVAKALCKLLKEMLRSQDPSTGTGKPEPLKHSLSGLWSRRISQKDRLIYRFDDQSIYIFALGGHYDQH